MHGDERAARALELADELDGRVELREQADLAADRHREAPRERRDDREHQPAVAVVEQVRAKVARVRDALRTPCARAKWISGRKRRGKRESIIAMRNKKKETRRRECIDPRQDSPRLRSIASTTGSHILAAARSTAGSFPQKCATSGESPAQVANSRRRYSGSRTNLSAYIIGV